jgi:hypothetical protein
MTDNWGLIKLAKMIFWIGFAIAIFSFFCPFVDKDTGLDIYTIIIKEVFNNGLSEDLIFVVFLLSCIALWLPITGYTFYRYTLQKRHYTINQRLINYFLFAIGFPVYVLPAYLYSEDAYLFSAIAWGYWLLMTWMTIMFICYLIVQKEQLIDNDDFSKHLINND